ncbi:PAS domain-containing protein [Pannus brasiliensis CCIBt3594]|uniref:histidine kinase n=1 Tax=Pannus brasiliensis CCIBt3594 TaxID=1427578 RepID=A0AAW9R1C9_9CHRO
MNEVRGRALRYAGAIGISLLALGLMLLLDPYLQLRQTPFLFFVGAITISAWYGGTDAGFLTTALSALLAHYYLVEPRYSLFTDSVTNTRTVLFLVQGGIISYLCGMLRETRDRARSNLKNWQASEERYRQLAARLEAVLQQMPAGVLLADARSEKLLLANEQVEKILGYDYQLNIALEKYDDIVTFEGFSADGKPLAPEKWPLARSLRAGETVRDEEIEIRWTDGRRIFIEINASPIRDDRGEIVSAVAIFQDITERVEIESALRQSETLLNAFLAGSPVGMAFLDRQLRYVHANEALATINGRPLSEHFGRRFGEVLPDRAAWGEEIFRRVMETKIAIIGDEIRGKASPNAPYRHCLVNIYPVCLPDGEVLGVGVTAIDITALKENEALARARATELEIFMETVPVPVWIARDPLCRQMSANRAAYELIRQSPGSIVTATPADGKYPFSFKIQKNGADIPLDDLPMQRAGRTGQQVKEEFEFVFAGDDIRYIFGNAVPIFDETDRVRGVIGAFLDLTERVETERRLQQQARQLENLNAHLTRITHLLGQRNRELDRFAHVVSHDLKAPLRAIANLSVWIEEDLEEHLSGEVRQNMNLLRGRVYRLEALIDGLLAYSRIGRSEVRSEWVKVGELLDEVIDSLAVPPRLTVKIGPDLPTLWTKRVPLGQVFSNLIGNAIKHHDRAEGAIEIDSIDRGESIEFTVKDDGPGIAPEFHERIFGIFQTLQPRDRQENTGIGLSIVKKILDTEGGKIWLDSREGEGATFHFTWPKKTPPEESE